MAGDDAWDDDLDVRLAELGFEDAGSSRRGGRMWRRDHNRFLRIAVHDHGDDRLVVSWSFAWGEYVLERGWQLSTTDATAAELYPATDVAVARDADAVRAEVVRLVATLRIDLGAADL